MTQGGAKSSEPPCSGGDDGGKGGSNSASSRGKGIKGGSYRNGASVQIGLRVGSS